MANKIRKVGNSMVVTVPASLKLKPGTEYETAYLDENNNLVFKLAANANDIVDADKLDIFKFMDQFEPLMQKLKDK